MKTLIAALVLSVSASASAETLSFSYSGLESWGRSYYSCDYVEARAEEVLELFGATNISTTCYGGIEYGRVAPVTIDVTFDAPVLNGVVERTTYKGDRWNPSCGLNVAMINSFVKSFPNVKVLAKRDRCVSETSKYSYDLEISR